MLKENDIHQGTREIIEKRFSNGDNLKRTKLTREDNKMNETAQQETNGTESEIQEERTFTQAELDAIVTERLKRDRAKYADYDEIKAKAAKFDEAEEASKTELQKATEKAEALQRQVEAMTRADEIRKIRENVATETGVPVNLLSGETAEECKAQADGILAFAKPAGYPQVKDAGELKNKMSSGSTAQQFADWFDKNTKF